MQKPYDLALDMRARNIDLINQSFSRKLSVLLSQFDFHCTMLHYR